MGYPKVWWPRTFEKLNVPHMPHSTQNLMVNIEAIQAPPLHKMVVYNPFSGMAMDQCPYISFVRGMNIHKNQLF
jgi:hypothetical protein